jgi:hypothetical protein
MGYLSAIEPNEEARTRSEFLGIKPLNTNNDLADAALNNYPNL